MFSTATEAISFTLHVDLAYGPISRKNKTAPPRDALPGEVPIVDISGIFSNDLSSRQAVAEEIRTARTGMGFFYIINHGIPDAITDNLAKASLDFSH